MVTDLLKRYTFTSQSYFIQDNINESQGNVRINKFRNINAITKNFYQ